MKTILLIGAGRMGGAMLRGWLTALKMPVNLIVVDPHNQPVLDELVEAPVPGKTYSYYKDAGAIPKGIVADALVLATKPQMVADAIRSVAPHITGQTVLASVAAGIATDTIAGAAQNTDAAVRIMPNIGAMVGHSASAGFANPAVTADQKALIEALFASFGVFSWLENEEQLHTVTALSGSGPAYYFALCEAMTEAAKSMGLPADVARDLAIGTVVAAGRLLEQTADPTHLRETVTSPNGTTHAGLMAMAQDEALQNLAAATLKAAHDRSIELA
ncbi:pyrroline-5-carboxylate reductase [Cognatishimia sp. SS12]|uniref:pyrroline-5-carboxylate reductase n=1 Tax=Cognatishimia sp. SS12 TaxID=2979465 RepID=UPI0023308AAA|nr:pyrroline-5-carboxylate reductase [Cognatishimia sp. SS12]MDC0737988.1 pyrroline-5-carboxylate reductase [Cognatishimia sp. SS12]